MLCICFCAGCPHNLVSVVIFILLLSLFELSVVLYAVSAVYFAGVMVRLMLTLTPVVCVLSGIAFSHTYEKYLIDDGEQCKRYNLQHLWNIENYWENSDFLPFRVACRLAIRNLAVTAKKRKISICTTKLARAVKVVHGQIRRLQMAMTRQLGWTRAQSSASFLFLCCLCSLYIVRTLPAMPTRILRLCFSRICLMGELLVIVSA